MSGKFTLIEVAELKALQAREESLRVALRSIANSSCCGCCQEAALVAQHALILCDGGYK